MSPSGNEVISAKDEQRGQTPGGLEVIGDSEQGSVHGETDHNVARHCMVRSRVTKLSLRGATRLNVHAMT